MAKKSAYVKQKSCVACGACTAVCPKEAVSIHRGCYAVTNSERCVGCGKCAGICPAGCIEIKEREQS